MRSSSQPFSHGADYRHIREALFGPLILNALVTGISLVLMLLPVSTATLVKDLGASSVSPWGVFTSIFVHSSWTHLSANAEGLALFTLFFVLTQVSLPTRIASTRSKVFLLGSRVSAMVANLLWVFLAPNLPAVGASGVAYAAAGFVLIYSLRNSFPPVWNTSGLRKWVRTRGFLLSLVNLTLFFCIFLLVVEAPAVFLSEAPGVNVFAHGVAFLSSFTAGLFLGFSPQGKARQVIELTSQLIGDGQKWVSKSERA